MNFSKRVLALIILDILTFILMVLGILFSVFDVRFMVDYPRLSTLPIYWTFTGLSNIFIGLVSLGCAIYRLVRKESSLSKPLFLIKVIAVAEITITFVITACVLAPRLGSSWWRLYINNNLINHFLTPLLAIFTYLFLEEKVEIENRLCFFAVVPMLAYCVFYGLNVYTRLGADGSIDPKYDIYGLAKFGPFFSALFLISFVGLSIGFTMLYRLQNDKKK